MTLPYREVTGLQVLSRLLLGVCVWSMFGAAMAQNAVTSQPKITSIQWVSGALKITCSGDVQFQARSLSTPYRLMVDITPCTAGMGSVKLPTNEPASVTGIRLGQFTEQTARVVVDLKGAVAYSLEAGADKKSVVLRLGASLPSTTVSKSSNKSTPPPVSPKSSAVTSTKTTKLPAIPAAGVLDSNIPPAVPSANIAGVAQLISYEWDVSGKEAKLVMQFDSPVNPVVRALDDGYGVKLDFKSCLVAAGVNVNAPVNHPYVDRCLVAPAASKRTIGMVFASRKPCAVDMPVSAPSDTVVIVMRAPKAVNSIKGAKICVDPGHGGFSSGAVGRSKADSVLEKDVTLAIGKKLAEALHQRGAQVVLTRDNDTFVELDRRPMIAVENNAEMFISIHCDSNQKINSASGTTAYYHARNGDGRALAQALQHGFTKFSGLPSRGVRSDTQVYATGFAVLRRSQVPSVLVETAFINNAQDRAKLVDPNWQTRVAEALAGAVEGYLTGAESTLAAPTEELNTQSADSIDEVTNPEPVDVVKPATDSTSKISEPKPKTSEPKSTTPSTGGNVQKPESLEY